MNRVFSYYRVSSRDQEQGASLEAQREANIRYAETHELEIVGEFREVQSATKGQRKEFHRMLKECQKGKNKVDGIVFHDVDRSSRSWADWAKIHELKEMGVQIHFSREDMEMEGRGNMLTADIKAAIAADQIRNLKQETKKGMYKKLNDGYAVIGKPLLGYVAKGGGVREIDPNVAPLIKECFELYATGNYSLNSLCDRMFIRGLRSREGKKVDHGKMSRILNNKFYIGIITVKGEPFQGRHVSLITTKLFEKVQNQLKKRYTPKVKKFKYKFAHLLICGLCKRKLRTMTAKGKYHYYYCRNKECQMTTILEENVERMILSELEGIKFEPSEVEAMLEKIKSMRISLFYELKEKEKMLKVSLENVKAKISKLLDLQIDGQITKEVFTEKKNQLFTERTNLENEISTLWDGESNGLNMSEELVMLLQNPSYAYSVANSQNKAKLIEKIMKNIFISSVGFSFEWQTPFNLLAKRKNDPI